MSERMRASEGRAKADGGEATRSPIRAGMCVDSHCARGLWRVCPALFTWSHPELRAPAGGIRLPVAREDHPPERAGPVKGGAAAARRAGILDGAEHSGIIQR